MSAENSWKNCYFLAALEEEQKNNANSNGTDKSELTSKQKHQMKHRELFLSRQVETLPATHIRGKCSVTLLNEEESLLSYLNKDVSSCTVDIPLSQISLFLLPFICSLKLFY